MELLRAIVEFVVYAPFLVLMIMAALYPFVWCLGKAGSLFAVLTTSEAEDCARHAKLPPLQRVQEHIFGTPREKALSELGALARFFKKCQPVRCMPGKWRVMDQGVDKGEFTLDEICLHLNRGALSDAALLSVDGNEWRPIYGAGISYEISESQPAPSWAG